MQRFARPGNHHLNFPRMKYLVQVVIVLVLLAGCSKEPFNENCYPFKFSSIAGKWELRQTVSSWGIQNYPSSNGLTIQFGTNDYLISDSAYKILPYPAYATQGLYEIRGDLSASTSTGLAIGVGEFEKRIILNNDTLSSKIFYQVKGNQLILLSGYFPTDGGVKKIYERIK